MTALITDDSRDRTQLNIFRMVGALLCGITVSMLVMPMVNGFGGGSDAWQKTFGIFSVVAVALFMLCFLGTKERVGASTKKEDLAPVGVAIKALFKNKYWYLITGNSIIMAVSQANMGVNVYFAKYWMNDENLVGLLSMSMMIPMFIGLFFMAPVVAKWGKRNVMLAGNLVSITGIIVQLLNHTNTTFLIAGNALKGLGMTGMVAVSFVMVADVIDYGEWKTGIRTDGLTYSASSFGGKVGTGLGAAILGWALACGGFDAALAVQGEGAMNAILFVFIYLPLILTIISTVLMWMYKLDKQLPGILSDLNERHRQAEKV
jgi:GPH family glycoside/pentoside/hexuronide:cation symporter